MLLALILAASPLAEAALKVRPPGVMARVEERKNGTFKVTGSAPHHEAVADYMRALAALVETPKGLGRVVERMRGAKTARVELFSGEVEDFALSDLVITDVELERADSTARGLSFDIRLRAPRV